MLHIDLPTRSEIEKLSDRRGFPTVSLYLRTTPVTQETQGDRITLKTLLKSAVSEMEEGGVDKRAVAAVVDQVEALIDDDGFWVDQANSLAIFATPDHIDTFRLPNHLQNTVEVSDRAHLKPLLRAVTFPHNAYVLAISMGAVRLVEISADLPPHEVRIPELPRDMSDALGKRSHTQNTAERASGLTASESAMLTRYARVVDRVLRPVLSGHERPLIVAASEPLASTMRSVSTYPHTADQVIGGSADRTPDHELAAEARKILDGIYAERIASVSGLYGERESQGRATTDVANAARAATYGAVDTLIFDMDEVLPGTVADEDGAVTFADGSSAGSYGIVDEIAARALRSGATLLAARREDVPGGGSLAAILRYAI